MYSNTEGGFSMRDIKTYLSVAPVLSTLWFGALAGLLIEINRLFPDALSFPFFLILVIPMQEIEFFVT
jgi:photosystem I subunit 9